MFRSSAGKYREIINNAISADKVVRQKFEDNSHGIGLLSKSPEELHQAIPAGAGCVSNSPAVSKLRELMEAVETVKAERDVIEAELKSATVDMKDQFLRALAQDGAIDPATVVAHVGKSLNPLQKQVGDSVSRQGSLISSIQQAHQQFTTECGSGSNQRDQLLSQLASAYDIFTELQHNLKEGTKFYNDLTQLLIVFQNKVSDFCFARKTEKEELLKDLTAESSRQASGAIPALPGHHGNSRDSPRFLNSNFVVHRGDESRTSASSTTAGHTAAISRQRALPSPNAGHAVALSRLQLHAADASVLQSLRDIASRWDSVSS
jgi:programmed cell death 6-interacting protein